MRLLAILSRLTHFTSSPLTSAVDLSLVFCDVCALEPLAAAIAGEAGLVIDASPADHLLGDIYCLACGVRGRGALTPGW